MPGINGKQVKGWAFAKFGTNSWGVAASVTKGARFMGDGGMKLQPVFVEDRSFGETFLGASDFGDVQAVDVSLGGQMRYEDNNYVLEALSMGSPATPTISTSTAGQNTSWQHVFDLAPAIDGLGATFALDQLLYTEELTSAKIYGFSLAVGQAGILEETFKVLGMKPTNISSININSTVYGASFPALGGKVARKQGTFRLNKQSGGALGATDAMVVETIDLTFERPQDRVFAFGQDYIVEPGDNDFPVFSLKVGFARMNTITANSLYQAIRTGDTHKADVTWLGAFINSTDTYKVLYQFPYLELQDWDAPMAGAAQVKPTGTFMLKQASAAPTGMAGVTKPFRLTKIMMNSVVAF
jgi:hypothetical protein